MDTGEMHEGAADSHKKAGNKKQNMTHESRTFK